MQTRSPFRARATGYVLLLACALFLVGGGLALARGVDISRAANRPWISLAPNHDCQRDGTTTRCSAVDQDGQPLTMYMVDQPGGGANLYVIRPGRDRASILMVTGESLLLIGLSALILGVSRMRSGTLNKSWLRRTSSPVLVILAVLAISFAASPAPPSQPPLVSVLRVGILSLGIGAICFALITGLLTDLRRKPVRIGGMVLSPGELATVADLIDGKVVTADYRLWMAATQIAHRRRSLAIVPAMTGLLLLLFLPLLFAAVAGFAEPWVLWWAAGCETIMLIMGVLLMLRSRVRARRFLGRVEAEDPTAEPMPNAPAAAIDPHAPSPWRAEH